MAAETVQTPEPSAAPVTAYGRALGDFPDRSAAENELLQCCRLGTTAKIAGDCPEESTEGNQLRASFIRFLALGGDRDAPVHEHGVQLEGGWVNDTLDLGDSDLPRPLGLRRCRLEAIVAIRANVRSLDLRGSFVEGGIYAPWLKCEGEVNLGENFSATAMVLLGGASITGNLQANGGRFDYVEGDAALLLDGIKVGGDVLFRDGFQSNGEIRLIGANIGGDLGCSGALMENPGADALSCHGAVISGGVFLNEGFTANGAVHLTGSNIRGSVECETGSFCNPDGIAFSMDRAEVSGSLFFRRVNLVQGEVHLTNARVGILCDDGSSWSTSSELILDGLTYRAGTSVSASSDPNDRVARDR